MLEGHQGDDLRVTGVWVSRGLDVGGFRGVEGSGFRVYSRGLVFRFGTASSTNSFPIVSNGFALTRSRYKRQSTFGETP